MMYDLHIHSKYSYDSILEPRTIITVAKKRNLNGIAITDHNTIKGALVAQKENQDQDFDIIVGAEIKTNIGDIVGLHLQEEIKSRNFIETVDEIKRQGGVSVLAHPFRKQTNYTSDEIRRVDLIEAFNARSPRSANIKAKTLATQYKKDVVAGSDAHLSFEIGKGRTTVTSDTGKLINGRLLSIEGMESRYYVTHGTSILIQQLKKSVKRIDPYMVEYLWSPLSRL